MLPPPLPPSLLAPLLPVLLVLIWLLRLNRLCTASFACWNGDKTLLLPPVPFSCSCSRSCSFGTVNVLESSFS